MSVHALVSGQLFADPEQRTSAGGRAFTKASLVQRDGEAMSFVRLVAFGSLADELAELRKGDAVSATGRLKAGAYVDKRGEPAASLELVVDRLLPLQAPTKQRSAPAPRPPAPAPRQVETAPTAALQDWPNDL